MVWREMSYLGLTSVSGIPVSFRYPGVLRSDPFGQPELGRISQRGRHHHTHQSVGVFQPSEYTDFRHTTQLQHQHWGETASPPQSTPGHPCCTIVQKSFRTEPYVVMVTILASLQARRPIALWKYNYQRSQVRSTGGGEGAFCSVDTRFYLIDDSQSTHILH